MYQKKLRPRDDASPNLPKSILVHPWTHDTRPNTTILNINIMYQVAYYSTYVEHIWYLAHITRTVYSSSVSTICCKKASRSWSPASVRQPHQRDRRSQACTSFSSARSSPSPQSPEDDRGRKTHRPTHTAREEEGATQERDGGGQIYPSKVRADSSRTPRIHRGCACCALVR